MAIAFDNATNGGVNSSSSTTHTFAHAVGTGSDRCLVVECNTLADSDQISGVTYAGVAMTLHGTSTTTGGRMTHFYYLLNPDTGSNNVVITATVSTRIIGAAASYTGVDQTTPTGASGSAAGAVNIGDVITVNVTTTATNSLVACVEADNVGKQPKTVTNNRVGLTSPDRTTGNGHSMDDSGVLASSGSTATFEYGSRLDGYDNAAYGVELLEAGGGGGGFTPTPLIHMMQMVGR